jgi:hypothetical protein
VQDQPPPRKRPAAAAEDKRNRTKAITFNIYMAAEEGSDKAKEFKPVKDKIALMKAELNGTPGGWRAAFSEVINSIFEKNEKTGQTELNLQHPVFQRTAYRKENNYDKQWHEGELREVVEARIPPSVVQGLIESGKAKYDGVMVFLPKKQIGTDSEWGHIDEGGKKTDITENEWNELESGIKDAMTAIPIAMPSVSQSSGSGRVGTGNVSSGSNGIPSQVVFLLCTP